MRNFAAGFALIIKLSADVNRGAALEVGNRKSCLAVAAIHRSKQRKQRLVLIDWQQLAVSLGPTSRRKVKRKDLYLAHEPICPATAALGGKNTKQRNNEVHNQV